MRNIYTLLLLVSLASNLYAQTASTVMETRSRSMYKAIISSDKEQWKKFIKENYSQALIDKPMRASINTEENGTVVSSTKEDPKDGTAIDKKAAMFAQLHSDFGDSEISSLKVEGQKSKMILESPSGARGVISLTFSKTEPYLIEALGIEVEN